MMKGVPTPDESSAFEEVESDDDDDVVSSPLVDEVVVLVEASLVPGSVEETSISALGGVHATATSAGTSRQRNR
jgi:hypothetical protein